MSKPKNTLSFKYRSYLAPWFSRFVEEKQALGFRYINGAMSLRRLDSMLFENRLKTEELPENIVEQWLLPQPYHSPRTLVVRRSLARQLALFLARNGIPAYIPPAKEGPIVHPSYVPYVFSREEIQKLLTVIDSLSPSSYAPLRHLILPELFRLLYGCGLRISEATRLQVKDVDLVNGILTIKEAKDNNDRLVPLASTLNNRLVRYAKVLGDRPQDAPFFPAPDGGFYNPRSMYNNWRKILLRTGIHHGGPGRGPRLHDLRHTYAVHRLIKWYRDGVDLNAKLPVLATYLGHKRLSGTQQYLHLTAEIFPDLTLNLESAVGYVIPRRSTP